MRASLNHGKSAKGRKRSLSPIRSQRPVVETLLTSTKVGGPSFADFIFVLPNRSQRGIHLTRGQTVILSQLDIRFHPELGFALRSFDVNVHPWFLTREKVETERTITKDRWAHAAISYIEASRLPPSGITAWASAASGAQPSPTKSYNP